MTEPDWLKVSTWHGKHELKGNFVRHYTSPSALIGIVQTGRIWATDARFLNDYREIAEGISIVRSVVEAALQIHKLETLEKLMIALRDRGLSQRIYVASFSKEDDDLSQWRAYSSGKIGVCLTFFKPHLERIGGSQGFEMAECIYEFDQKVEAAEAEVELLVAELEAIEGQDVGTTADQEADRCFRRLVRLAASMKSPAFHAESEWRAIQIDHGGNNPNLEFRATSLGVVPYTMLNLEEDDSSKWTKDPLGNAVHGKLGITQYTLYPANIENALFDSVSSLVWKHNAGGGIKRSSCPHRT